MRIRGFKLDVIYPADDPHTAVLSSSHERIRVTTRPGAEEPAGELTAFASRFEIARAENDSRRGRAGMLYRDLIPSRLGGRYVGSQISIPDARTLEDWVHFHQIALQLLYVRCGWVRVVYEDQGDPIMMREGDLVLQPPEIRHKVLDCSNGLEVIELTAPANHSTFADHDLELPNAANSTRTFGTQRFFHHVSAVEPWRAFHAGAEAQETRLGAATSGLAQARILRGGDADQIDFGAHDGEIVFNFVIEGTARLEFDDGHDVHDGDAFVIPPGKEWRLSRLSSDFRLLNVTTAHLD